MYPLNYLYVISLVTFTVHSVQPWDGLGVITNSQIQFIKGTDVQKTVPIQWDHKKVVATYNPVDKHVYISEQPTNSKNGSIYRIKFIGNQERPYAELIVADQQNRVSGMAFNDRTSTLYWASDNTIKHARISKLTTTVPFNGSILLNLKDSSLGEIQLDACRGYLYYINWFKNGNVSTIERSPLDGSHQKVLFYFNGLMLLSLTVDVGENRLYWATLNPSMKRDHFSVESSDLDGGSRRTVIKVVDHFPLGLAYNENNLYWFDTRSKSLWTMPKDGNTFPIEVMKYNDSNKLLMTIMTATFGNQQCNATNKSYLSQVFQRYRRDATKKEFTDSTSFRHAEEEFYKPHTFSNRNSVGMDLEVKIPKALKNLNGNTNIKTYAAVQNGPVLQDPQMEKSFPLIIPKQKLNPSDILENLSALNSYISNGHKIHQLNKDIIKKDHQLDHHYNLKNKVGIEYNGFYSDFNDTNKSDDDNSGNEDKIPIPPIPRPYKKDYVPNHQQLKTNGHKMNSAIIQHTEIDQRNILNEYLNLNQENISVENKPEDNQGMKNKNEEKEESSASDSSNGFDSSSEEFDSTPYKLHRTRINPKYIV